MRPWGVDEESADAFCRTLYPRLAGALRLQWGDPAVAEELAQDALLRAWARWPQVREMRSPEAWVFRVAFNLGASRLRRVLAERRAHDRLKGDAVAWTEPATADAMTARAAVGDLPPRQRAAVVLRYFADLSVDETAEALGCAPGTVKSLTSQAVHALRARLALDEEEPVDA